MIIKDESEPIGDDEWLIRLVWDDFMKRLPNISPNAFEPRATETDGISFFRRRCLEDPTDALTVIADAKRSRYGLVKVSISLITTLRLSVKPDPISLVPGHVVVPEINSTDYNADKAKFTPIKKQLADEASKNIILKRPIS